MNFPADPINGQTTTINGIVYIYDSTKTAWKRSTSFAGNLTILGNITSANVVTGNVFTSGGIYWSNNGAAYSSGGGGGGSSNFLYTASATAPGSPTKGDQWFDTTDGTLYEYIDDGDSFQWIDIQTPTLSSDAIVTSLSGDVSTTGNIAGNIVIITSGVYWSNGTAFASSLYSNVNVEAYIGANIGAYQTYANANIGTLSTSINTINANLGAYQTYANTIIYSNANVVSMLVANTVVAIGPTSNTWTTSRALQIGSASFWNLNSATNTYLGQNYYYDGAARKYIQTGAAAEYVMNAGTHQWLGAVSGSSGGTVTLTSLMDLSATSNLTIGATGTGNIVLGNVFATANIRTTSNVVAANFMFANGVNILNTVTGSYGNTNVASYLTQGASIGTGTTTSNLLANATTTSTSTTTGALVVRGGAGIAGRAYIGAGLQDTVIGNVTASSGAFTTISASGQATFNSDFVVTGGGKITSTGIAYLIEKANVVAAVPAATLNVDLATVSVMYWTSNATANVTANIRGTSTQTLNSLLATGQSVTAVLFFPNGPSNYLINTVKIDNTTVPVAYQGNAAPVLGNSDSIDIYSFTILKTADATYKVFGSQTQFMHPG